MENEERTFKVLKGLSRDEIEEIILEAKTAYNFRDIDDYAKIINQELEPYGWSLKKYYEYFY